MGQCDDCFSNNILVKADACAESMFGIKNCCSKNICKKGCIWISLPKMCK